MVSGSTVGLGLRLGLGFTMGFEDFGNSLEGADTCNIIFQGV